MILHHSDGLAVRGAPQHEFHEIAAVRGQPARPEDPTDPKLGGYEITVQPNGLTDVKEFAGIPDANGTRTTC